MISPLPDAAPYQRLAALLREEILTGAIPPGSKLPSETRLMQEYGLARGTVRRALGLLRGEGLVIVRPPYGTTVRPVSDRPDVVLHRGASVTVRMPTPAERRDLDLDEGVPVVIEVFGSQRVVHPGDAVFRTR